MSSKMSMSKKSQAVTKKSPLVPMTPAEIISAVHAADPVLRALDLGSMSWGDAFMLDEPEMTLEELEAWKASQIIYLAARAERDAETAEARRLVEEAEEAEAETERKYMEATWAAEEWWGKNRCVCTHEEVDSLPMGSDVPCLCFKRVHLTEDGEPEECKFFNSPSGCRDGAGCVYRHVERNPAEMPCRFEASAAGCHPAFGRTCPYKHLKPQTGPVEVALCRFDGRCNPAKGKTCPYRHEKQGGGEWRIAASKGAGGWRK